MVNEKYMKRDRSDDKDAAMAESIRNFGNNIRAERKRRGFSANNMAELVDLSASYLCLLERGARAPSFKALLCFCGVLGKTPDELLSPRERLTPRRAHTAAPNEHDKAAAPEKRDNYDAVVSMISILSDKQLECVASMLKALRKLT